MKKKFLLVAAATFFLGNTMAQTPVLPEGMEILTPDGVTLTTSDVNSYDKAKNMVIAGSKENGYKLYFTAQDAEHGEELWVSDGTAQGTHMVKDIYPGEVSSNVSYITRFNEKVVFQATANDDEGGELWISDGTEAGTQLISDINLIGGSEPMGFVQINENQFIFAAKDVESITYHTNGEPQWWLWISDGTAEGTSMLKDCFVKYPGTQLNNMRTHFVRCGRKVFFKADTKDLEYGETLWVTDGTTEGTFPLGDLNKTVTDENTGYTASARIDWMTNFKNERVFFCAFSDEYGNEPWTSDGTVEGTYVIADMQEGLDANNLPRGAGTYTATAFGDHVYFRGSHPQFGMELFRTDFTKEGTQLVKDINVNPTESGTASSQAAIFCEFDGVLFLQAQTGTNADLPGNYGIELVYTDGTEEGTKVPQSDLNEGVGNNAAWEGIVASGSFYFRAQDQTPPTGSSQYWELFSMDSKDEKPRKVADLGEGADFVHTLRNLNGDLVFTSKIIPALFKYHYRKPGYDPNKDVEDMDPDFGPEQTAIQDVETKNLLTIYPNPAQDLVTINTPNKIIGCTVADLTGRIVIEQKGDKKTISISDLAKGTYLLSVSTSEGKLDSKLIVE